MKENALQQNLWHAIGGLSGYVESRGISGAKRIWRRLRRGLKNEFSEEWQSIVR